MLKNEIIIVKNEYIKDNINADRLEKIYEKKNPSTNITS